MPLMERERSAFACGHSSIMIPESVVHVHAAPALSSQSSQSIDLLSQDELAILNQKSADGICTINY